MKRYEKIPDEEIPWVAFEECAFKDAQQDYLEHTKVDFADDVLEYMEKGFLVSRPGLFAMARPVEFRGERGWFIRYARGNIFELITVLPCPMAFIMFCRKNDGILRRVDWREFIKMAVRHRRKGL